MPQLAPSDSPIIITSQSTHIDACKDAFNDLGGGTFRVQKSKAPQMILFFDGGKVSIDSGEWSVKLSDDSGTVHTELSGAANSGAVTIQFHDVTPSSSAKNTQLDHPGRYAHTHGHNGASHGPGCVIIF